MFVRDGLVNPGDHLNRASGEGTYRSSVGGSANAYGLGFGSNRVNPSSIDYGHYDGQSVRRVALGG